MVEIMRVIPGSVCSQVLRVESSHKRPNLHMAMVLEWGGGGEGEGRSQSDKQWKSRRVVWIFFPMEVPKLFRLPWGAQPWRTIWLSEGRPVGIFFQTTLWLFQRLWPLGRGGVYKDSPESMNDSISTVFVEQPMTLPESAHNWTTDNIPSTSFQCSNARTVKARKLKLWQNLPSMSKS